MFVHETMRVSQFVSNIPDNNVHGADMGPTWVVSTPDGPHVGPIYLAIRDRPRCELPNDTAVGDRILSAITSLSTKVRDNAQNFNN